MIVKALLSILFVLITFAPIGNGNTEEMDLSTTFTFDFYRAIFNEEENIVLCPMSIRYILALLYQASTGETELELQEKINLGTKNQTFFEHRKILKKYKNDPNLQFLNKIWIKQEFAPHITDTFKAATFGYNTDIEGVDFTNKIETVDFINKWISRNTNKKIETIITAEDLDERREMLILNSVLFSAAWNSPFSPDDMFSKKFRGTQVNMMTSERELYYAKIDSLEAEVLDIPFIVGTLFSFWIILPDEESSISEVKDLLTYDMIQEIDNSLQRTQIDLFLPLFNITTSVDTEQVLEHLGITSIFKNSDINILEGNKLVVKINSFTQKINFRIDLNGTEGISELELLGAIDDDHTEFHCDRPFIFLIVTQAIEKDVVFIGHYAKP